MILVNFSFLSITNPEAFGLMFVIPHTYDMLVSMFA